VCVRPCSSQLFIFRLLEVLIGKSYRDLIAWQKSIEFVSAIYAVTSRFPKEELYGLTSQLRRAAVSIPSNIAEGQGRKSEGEFRHFLHNFTGSLMEVETQLTIANMPGFLSDEESAKLLASAAEIGRILNGLIASLA
jgi:four helix bundle protein